MAQGARALATKLYDLTLITWNPQGGKRERTPASSPPATPPPTPNKFREMSLVVEVKVWACSSVIEPLSSMHRGVG